MSEEVNQERDEHEEVSEEEIEDTLEDEPDEVITNDPYHRYEIYRIAEASLQIVVRTTGDKIVDYFVEELEQETRCPLDEADVDMTVDSTERDQFVAASSEYKAFLGTFERTNNPVETDLLCADDPDAVIQTYADDPSDITDGSLGENISVELVEERGYEVKWPVDGFDEGDASEIGPDIIAYDNVNDEWLIVEAKTTTSTDTVGIELLQTDAYTGEPQLSDQWIDNIMSNLNDAERIAPQFVQDVEDALNTGNITKEIVFVRDTEGASHRTLKNPRDNSTDISIDTVVGIDEVTIVELQATED